MRGTLKLSVNTTGAAVNETFRVGSVNTILNLVRGPYFRFEAENLEIDVLGQTLSGNFAFERAIQSNGAVALKIAAANVSLALGGAIRW